MAESPPPPPPSPLGYGGPHTPPPLPPQPNPRRFLLQFLGGLVVGGIVSALVWYVGWEAFMGPHAQGYALFVVPGIKLAVAIVFLCIRGWRGVGAGLLLSIGLGALIFFVTCFAHLDLK